MSGTGSSSGSGRRQRMVGLRVTRQIVTFFGGVALGATLCSDILSGCDPCPGSGTATGSGTGTATGSGTGTGNPEIPPMLNCLGIETQAPAELTMAFSDCTGIYAVLNGKSYTLLYNGDFWEAVAPAPEFAYIRIYLSDAGSGGTLPTFNVQISGCFELNDGNQPTTCDPFSIINFTSPGNGTCGVPSPGPDLIKYTVTG